ncbi:MAG: hypothetical protein CMH22_05645 [Methylophaga sp.]|nr:hypothetical protein [Methylophaga sp.]|tara:strand:+ start:101595 stop:103589 length:1995 start_codon:yes stop_codon:yes gene_type:complete
MSKIDLDTPLIGDIETKGFLEDIKGVESDLHVLGIAYKTKDGWSVKTTNKKEDVKKVFEDPNNTIVGHNFYMFDIPSLEKIFKGIQIKATIVDSLLVAWYIEPNRIKYGLSDYGEEFNVPKPKIDDWENLSYEEYVNRVTEDCKINTNTWFKHLKLLRDLYNNDDNRIESLLRFLMTKGKVYKMHQDNPLTLDIETCQANLELFDKLIEEIVEELKKVMPKVPVVAKRKRPKSIYKKDGTPSVAGERWLKIAEHYGVDEDYEGELEEVVRYDEPNPQSTSQVKSWLFSLNWKPRIYKDGANGKVPQLKDKNKDLCKSILKLVEEVPEIKGLSDLSLLQHRRGYFVGFLRDKIRGNKIVADIGGFTNTLRIKHRTLVNLIKPSAPYGEYVRSLLLPPEGYVMVGSDLSALESVTRNNFVFDIDRKFVEDQSHPFYDPHLEIAQIANMMTEAEVFFYKWWKEKRKNPDITFKEIGEIPEDFQIILNSYKTDEEKNEFHDKLDKKRAAGKVTNYSSMYGIGKVKLGEDLGIPAKEAANLIDAYWVKNNCVRVFSESCETKESNGQLWVKNPLNGYFYSLRSERDIFSTVNQGAGDYIFTLWQHNLMGLGVTLYGGFHDEIITCCKPEDCDLIVEKLKKAIDMVNRQLKLKVPVGIDYKIGNSYAEVH